MAQMRPYFLLKMLCCVYSRVIPAFFIAFLHQRLSYPVISWITLSFFLVFPPNKFQFTAEFVNHQVNDFAFCSVNFLHFYYSVLNVIQTQFDSLLRTLLNIILLADVSTSSTSCFAVINNNDRIRVSSSRNTISTTVPHPTLPIS